MEQRSGDVSDDTQQGIFLQQDDETEIEAPKHKVPARTVPKAGQKPDTEDVEGLMPPVSAHGDVDVVAEKATQRDVPAAPKLGDGATYIWVVEVFVEMKAQTASHADGHVGITREIEVDLEGEGQNADPSAGGAQIVERTAEELVDDFRELVGEQYFFPESDEEAIGPFGEVGSADVAVADFFGHGAVAHNGTGHQLREHRHIEQQATETILRGCVFAVHVDEVRHGLEGVETDTDREGNAGSAHRDAPSIEGVRDEIGIFERAECGEVAENAQNEEETWDGTAVDRDANEVIEHHTAQHQKNIHRFSPSIEDEGEKDEDVVLISLLWTVEQERVVTIAPGCQEVEQGEERKEYKEEEEVGENHVSIDNEEKRARTKERDEGARGRPLCDRRNAPTIEEWPKGGWPDNSRCAARLRCWCVCRRW